jgi:succinate dehydrogenase/fumarate reductase iron-sulfur protein
LNGENKKLLKNENNKRKYVEIKVKILRSDPFNENNTYWQSHKVTIQKDSRVPVLTLLRYIYENLDPSLSFSGPCEKGLCGSCALVVNGRTRLACNAFVAEDVTIQPIKGFKIIRDLIVEQNTKEDSQIM